jgi:hypothetical protein
MLETREAREVCALERKEARIWTLDPAEAETRPRGVGEGD